MDQQMANVLIACEFSGVVRRAFQAQGHQVTSVDLLPSLDESGGSHLQTDVVAFLKDNAHHFDLMIAHPPCTFLANSGVHLLEKQEGRKERMREGASFFRALLEAPIPRICVENPVMHKYAVELVGRKHNQTIQPYQFGHPESKRTCLWLKGLPPLTPTKVLTLPPGEKWANQTPSGQNKLGPSPDRWKLRSITYQGIADAMASQWGPLPPISREEPPC